MDLVLPTHAFGEAIIETSKIHNLFIQYPNNTYLTPKVLGVFFIKTASKQPLFKAR
jgi:hypothetical protein